MADELKIDFGDGVSALDRANRAIVLMLANAITRLEELGYDRTFDHITISVTEDERPCVQMRGELVFDIDFAPGEGAISIQGVWQGLPIRKRSWLRKLFSRRYRAGAA